MGSEQFDYSALVLTVEEQALFDRFKESDTATLTLDEYHILYGKNLNGKRLILPEINGEIPFYSDDDIQSGTCKLSQHGKELRVYQDLMRKAEAKAEERYRQEQAKADARDRRNYKIDVATLVVAIATFVVALIALLQNST